MNSYCSFKKKAVFFLSNIYLRLLELVDIIVGILPASSEVYKNRRRKLLIIRLDVIGDFIIFLDSLKEYRKLYSSDEWEITLLGNKIWADLALKLPYADHYWFIDKKKFVRSPFYRYKFLKKTRRTGFDTVIQSTFSREYYIGDSVVRASGAKKRIGSAGDLSNMILWQRKKSDRWYTHLIHASELQLTELERNAEFVRGLGLEQFKSSPPVYPVNVLSDLPQEILRHIKTPYFVIVPGAAVAGRQWQSDNYAKIAGMLHRATDWKPVICGGPGEEEISEKVISHASSLPWHNLSGKTSLSQTAMILSKAKILIGNETAAVHLASAVGCPTVCIIGGGHFGRFFPYGNLEKNRIVYRKMDCFECNWKCIYVNLDKKAAPCLTNISVDMVWQSVVDFLNKKNSAGLNHKYEIH